MSPSSPSAFLFCFFYCYQCHLTLLRIICEFEIMETRILSLDSLPAEILQQIATRGPSISAISLLLVCQKIRRACDHWTVWRSFIECSENFPNGIPETGRGKAWRNYVLADIKASRHEGVVRPEELRWLPMLMALNRMSNTNNKPYVEERSTG